MTAIARRWLPGTLAAVFVLAILLVGFDHPWTAGAELAPPPSFIASTSSPTSQSTLAPTPTSYVPEKLFDTSVGLRYGPVAVPLQLRIPALNVNAPILGVGLTDENVMDAPKGPIGDPIWHAAYWYRGGSIPGDAGTATVAGHVNDPLGVPEIFADLDDLQPGDLIFIHDTRTNVYIRFIVDEVVVYSLAESSEREVLARIFGAGPVAGMDPQPGPDGLAHLTLITCAGDIMDGRFDHHVVVYTTRSD